MKTPVSDWGSWQTQLNRGISFSWPSGMPYEFSKQDFGLYICYLLPFLPVCCSFRQLYMFESFSCLWLLDCVLIRGLSYHYILWSGVNLCTHLKPELWFCAFSLTPSMPHWIGETFKEISRTVFVEFNLCSCIWLKTSLIDIWNILA